MTPDTTTLGRILAGEVRAIDTVTSPYTARRTGRAVAIALVVLALAAAAALTLASCVVSHPARAAAVTEDDPRWNCHTMGNRQCGAAATEDPTGTACGDATPGTLTAAAVSDLARYGTAQTRCLVLPAVLATAGPAALSALCSSGTGAVDVTTDAPTVTCRATR